MNQPSAPIQPPAPARPSAPPGPSAAPQYSPLGQLVLARLREFYREPEAVFWVYGFPILMTVALGIAFRNKPVEQINVTVQEGPGAEIAEQALSGHESEQVKFVARRLDGETAALRLRTGKTALVVIPPEGDEGGLRVRLRPHAARKPAGPQRRR